MSSNNPNSFMDPLVASSYFHPSGSEEYSALRKAVVAKATGMGYDVPTMTEHGVAWADDQDPFGHVGGATYARLIFKGNFRVFESFAKTLGDKYDELYRAKGVGVIIKSYNMDLKRQVVYPDCLLTAARISEVHQDRYFCTTSIWSYRQQAIVAESSGYVVFFDYRKGQVVNLMEYGGVYADLHKELLERAKRSNELSAQWVSDHPKSGNVNAKL
ncbi:hypothetical protein C8R44DRAFT_838888 [Mycena epipterygia]|nr:hypothetical protein C8R44DRAFT_838888 [Mycena epipterygia]